MNHSVKTLPVKRSEMHGKVKVSSIFSADQIIIQ